MIINQNVSGGGSSPAPADPMSLKLKVSSGILTHDNTSPLIDFTGVTTLDSSVLAYAYAGNTTITGTAFRNAGSLTTIRGDGALQAFAGCTGITATGLTNVSTVDGGGLQQTFSGCTGLTSVDVSSITEIWQDGMFSTFNGCRNLTGNISFDNLVAVYNTAALAYTFANTSITSVSFPALETISPSDYVYNDDDPENPYDDESGCNMFIGMLFGCSNVTVHFPSNFQERLSGWNDVSSGFGGTNITVLFDLDPTVEPEPEPEPEEPFEEEPIE